MSPMEAEEKVTAEWWQRWLVYREEVNKATESNQKKQKIKR